MSSEAERPVAADRRWEISQIRTARLPGWAGPGLDAATVRQSLCDAAQLAQPGPRRVSFACTLQAGCTAVHCALWTINSARCADPKRLTSPSHRSAGTQASVTSPLASKAMARHGPRLRIAVLRPCYSQHAQQAQHHAPMHHRSEPIEALCCAVGSSAENTWLRTLLLRLTDALTSLKRKA